MDSLTPLGEQIFLDRYAQKDPNTAQNLRVGDTVLVVEGAARLKGKTQSITDDRTWTTTLLDDGSLKTTSIDLIERPIETVRQMQTRVAQGIASVEKTPELREVWSARFFDVLAGWEFVPGGRIWTSAGTKYKLTAFNCYVIPSPHDSRGGIIATLNQMIEIMSRGGGVGINFSSLRPKHALVRGVNGRSSGPVSWMELFSTATGLIEQGGSRRGAEMAMLNDWHPDIFEFINAKRTPGKLTNCNISVCFSDAFMEALKRGADWTLRFPDTAHPDYNTLWTGDLAAWEAAGYPIVNYQTIKAQELWDAVIESAHASAEPGIFFLDRANKMSNSHYYSPIIATNPCAEEPLPAWGVCNLGALNLSKFVKQNSTDQSVKPSEFVIDWMRLSEVIKIAVRFLDNVVDWTPYFYPENENQQRAERRLGLGVMGLADMMIRLGIRYGSDEGNTFIDDLGGFIARNAYSASIQLAQEKGSFPMFDADEFLDSGFMQCMPDFIRNAVRQNGIRNVTVLTIAPTGTTSTMLNTSGGVEPFFALEWDRKTRLGTHKETIAALQEWRAQHGGEDLPPYFVTSMDLTPEEHVKAMAAFQRWIDAAISKTVNFPKTATPQQVGELYQLMYDLGCKGGTVYVDQSRSEQVLNLTAPTESTVPQCDVCQIDMQPQEGCWVCTCGNTLCVV